MHESWASTARLAVALFAITDLSLVWCNTRYRDLVRLLHEREASEGDSFHDLHPMLGQTHPNAIDDALSSREPVEAEVVWFGISRGASALKMTLLKMGEAFVLATIEPSGPVSEELGLPPKA